jgi:hypothetical protein
MDLSLILSMLDIKLKGTALKKMLIETSICFASKKL